MSEKQKGHRVRIKVFSAWHSAVVEQQINEWIESLEQKGLIPIIFAKKVAVVPSDGKLGIVISFFYRLGRYDPSDDPLAEVVMQ